jgi:hypothetical protein
MTQRGAGNQLKPMPDHAAPNTAPEAELYEKKKF